MLVSQPEAARLLRELATKPRETALWPLSRGNWTPNVLDAFEQGRRLLADNHKSHLAAKLRWTAEHPGCCVADVLRTKQWPEDVTEAMLDAALLLDPSEPSP